MIALFIGGMILGGILMIVGDYLDRREKAANERRFRERWDYYQRTGHWIGIDQWPD